MKKIPKNQNQRSFYFNEYNKNINIEKKIGNLSIAQDRIYLLFFVFFCLIFIFATKIFFVSIKSYDQKGYLSHI